jgi:pimeloyl-ACP methyl ester carboxylesterase
MSNARESYAHLADGRPIYYFEEGTGPPMLLVHGGAGSADSMRKMIDVLRDRFHCIALDRVGYRHSGALDRVTTLEEQVEAIAVVHSACTPDPLWILSHSSGGNFAVAYAVIHPDRVRGLVLIEPPIFAVFPAENRPPGVAAMMETIVPLLRKGRIDEGVKQFLSIHNPDMSPETLAGLLLPDRRAPWEAFAWDQLLVVSWAPTPAEWAGLTQPTLLIQADRTAASWYREVGAKMMELLPNAELVTLKGLDHGAIWQAPDVVTQRTVEFIDRVAAL